MVLDIRLNGKLKVSNPNQTAIETKSSSESSILIMMANLVEDLIYEGFMVKNVVTLMKPSPDQPLQAFIPHLGLLTYHF